MELEAVTGKGLWVRELETCLFTTVLNRSARPDKPDRTSRFGPGSGRKNMQMSQVGSGLGLPFLHFLQVVNYILFVVKSGCCFMGRGRRRPDAAEYINKCIRKTMQARGGSGSAQVRADSSRWCVGLRRVQA